uniref:Uncharacterized protein n=1 Tax=Tanacetum cinerariifolium TaxID=118510 RepID=A0A6L2ND82_TANCI|nr:hypothetical protein [Tanacetum cinerariifolium]
MEPLYFRPLCLAVECAKFGIAVKEKKLREKGCDRRREEKGGAKKRFPLKPKIVPFASRYIVIKVVIVESPSFQSRNKSCSRGYSNISFYSYREHNRAGHGT